MGADPRLLLDSLPVAVEVLTEPDPARAVATAQRHRLLHPAGQCTPTGPDNAVRRRPHNGLLAALRLGVADRTGELSPTAQLTFRVGSGRPRYPEPGMKCDLQNAALRSGHVPLRTIPQLLWPGVLTQHLVDPAAGVGDAGGQDMAAAPVMV